MKMSRPGKFSAALLFVQALVVGNSPAQEQQPGHPTFADLTPLEFTISGPFLQLTRDDEREEHDATLEYVDAEGAGVSIDIEVRIRGRSRLENCNFPPLSLDFPRDELAGTVFAGQNRLKLVTLCKRGRSYEDYLTTEFLIYRSLNELTDRSFRTRWATVQYDYTDTRRPRSETQPAFLIEEDWEVAERLGLEVVEVDSLSVESQDASYLALFALFQYLVGNTDWAVTAGPLGDSCCHNGKVIGNAGGPYWVLPYDFDNSGLVNASYAVPSEVLPIRSVRTRLYRGFCTSNAYLEAARLRIDQRRERLIELLGDESISERARERNLDYLNDYFEIVDDPELRQERIYGRCRK